MYFIQRCKNTFLTEMTKDSFYDDRMICYQNKKGYRFSIDSVLLAHFALHWKKATILDLGCGCGILGLLLLYRNYSQINSISGLELQESLVKVATMNCEANVFSRKMTIHHGDLRHIKGSFSAEHFSHIICNPPFYTIGTGRQNTNTEAFCARHQSTASLTDIVDCIAYSLKNKGLVAIIYPAKTLVELVEVLQRRHIQLKRLRIIYSYPESHSASLVLVECMKNGGIGLQILPPLFIYDKRNGAYTEEIKQMYLP